MAIRPSVFFQFKSGSQGWSERYWYTGPSSSLAIVQLQGKDLLAARSMMLATGVSIINAYASYDDEFRDVAFVELPPLGTGGIWNAGLTGDPSIPNDTVVIRCFSETRGGKFIYLSGAPDGDLNYPPLYTPAPRFTPNFRAAVNNFLLQLINANWGWKGITFGAGGPTSNVTAMVAGAQQWTVTNDLNPAGVAAGDRVKLVNAVFTGSANQRANRTYRVLSIPDATHLVLDWGGADLSGLAYVGMGKLQLGIVAVIKITNAYTDKLGTRKRGVGPGRPVGRRKAK